MPCPIPFYGFIIISLLTRFVAYVCGSTSCPPFHCGDISDIGYPFRQPTDYDCENPVPVECVSSSDDSNSNLTMTIGSARYKVNSIAPEKQSLNITIETMDLSSDLCPEQYENPIFNHPLFHYVRVPGTQFATLYYNCKMEIDYTHSFSCGIPNVNSVGYLFFYKPEFLEQQHQLSEGCSRNVSVTLLEIPIPQPSTPDTMHNFIVAALHNEFEITWKKVDTERCGECNNSGVGWMYNTTGDGFICFFPGDGVPLRICQQHDEFLHPTESKSRSKSELRKILIVVGMVILGTSLLLSIILFVLLKKQRLFSKKNSRQQDIEEFIKQYGSLAPKRYNYSEVKRITNSFNNELGQGGYGVVYKGMLQNGSSVAVKILNTSKGNGEEFINEVASISQTSHVNIVTLLGFCFEGKRRALIYEFMANGSLDKFLNNEIHPYTPLGWKKLHEIAVGIARGLEYLHRGCNTRILHFDIKPHNILLDEDFQPKISDFGLAKLCLKKESIVSMMIARGTIGYIAPEVFSKCFGEVSPKSDVYSYGMLILEMTGVTKTKNVDGNSSQLYFPDWIYKRFERSQDLEIYNNLTSEEGEILRKMVLIGLWCIQTKPSERPSMSKVIEMLEGSVEVLQIPPKPYCTSPPQVIEGSYSTSTLLMEESYLH